MNELQPPAIVRSHEDPAALAALINAEHQAGERATRQGLDHFRKAGEALLRAKKLLGHGEWLGWLKANVQVSGRTARDYMRLARHWEKVAAAANLRAALQLLARPKAKTRTVRVRWEGDEGVDASKPEPLEVRLMRKMLDEDNVIWDHNSLSSYREFMLTVYRFMHVLGGGPDWTDEERAAAERKADREIREVKERLDREGVEYRP
jgi:hypothetical protein